VGALLRWRAQRGAEPPSYWHSRSLAQHREHLGRSPSHLVLETRQLVQDRYVRIFRRETGTERRPDLDPSSSTHSSWRRSQLRHPLGRPSHLTYTKYTQLVRRPYLGSRTRPEEQGKHTFLARQTRQPMAMRLTLKSRLSGGPREVFSDVANCPWRAADGVRGLRVA
jgi:hypothetical protein